VLLAFAYPDRVAKLRNDKSSTYLLANAKGAILHQQDELFNTGFLVIADLDARNTNANIYKAIAISHAQIERYLDEQLLVHEDVIWNEEQERVEARKITKLGAIVLKEVQSKHASQEKVTEVLLEELEDLGLEALNWSKEAETLRHRVNFTRHNAQVYSIDFPDFSETYLLENMGLWLAPYMSNMRTLKVLKSLDLHTILLGLMTFEQRQTLDKLAPAKLKVASGSHIAIDYSNLEQPILAVRLQEMFGTKTTPTVLNGKIRLMIHLLSPASRPMQVTMDLESFWKNTYDEVKKELRGKYKKHYWPDDPLSAIATSKTKKNM
jgi:ATP-dependent helicase HrpB